MYLHLIVVVPLGLYQLLVPAPCRDLPGLVDARPWNEHWVSTHKWSLRRHVHGVQQDAEKGYLTGARR